MCSDACNCIVPFTLKQYDLYTESDSAWKLGYDGENGFSVQCHNSP